MVKEGQVDDKFTSFSQHMRDNENERKYRKRRESVFFLHERTVVSVRAQALLIQELGLLNIHLQSVAELAPLLWSLRAAESEEGVTIPFERRRKSVCAPSLLCS